MTWVFWVIGGAVVFAIAAIAVGRVSANLANSPQRAVYDAHQSIEFVAQALPDEVTAELTYDDVRTILHLFHDHLHARGVATTAGEEAADIAVIDLEAAADDVVVRGRHADVVVGRSHALAVIEAQMAYFEAIGAVGDPAEIPEEP